MRSASRTAAAEGQAAAAPWVAYRDGLKQAAKDQDIEPDLDTALPDIVALNLGSAMDKRLKAAGAAGQRLRAFAGSGPGAALGTHIPLVGRLQQLDDRGEFVGQHDQWRRGRWRRRCRRKHVAHRIGRYRSA